MGKTQNTKKKVRTYIKEIKGLPKTHFKILSTNKLQ